MNEWKTVRLGDVCEIVNGFAFDSKLFNSDKNGVPLIRIRDVVRGFSETYTTENADSRFLVKVGDLLIGMDGEFNCSLWKSVDSFLNQRVCKIIPNLELIHKDYVYYGLQGKLKEIEDKTSFVTVKHISSKQIENIVLKYPPLETQKQIAIQLDKCTTLITKHKEILEKYDMLIKSRFIEMFGDPLENSKHWETQNLGNLCEIVRGGSPRPIDKFLGGSIPWIKIGDATNGDNIYLYKTKEYIIEEGIKKSRLIPEGSLIFANCGVSLGFARIIKFQGCIHDGWLAFQNIDKNLNNVFLLKSLNMCTDYFRKSAPDGTQPNLNTSIMKSFVQILPTIHLQEEYVHFVEQIDKSKIAVQKSLKKAETLYKSLMQEYFG